MYHSATKEYDADFPLVYRLGLAGKQNFQFTTTVTWTYIDPKPILLKPRTPSLFLSVPSDFFYPFELRSSNELKRANRWSFLLCTLSMVYNDLM